MTKQSTTILLFLLAAIVAPNAIGYELVSTPVRWFDADLPRHVTISSAGMASVSDGDNGKTAAVNALLEWNDPLISGDTLNILTTSIGAIPAVDDNNSYLSFDDPDNICSGSCLAVARWSYWSTSMTNECTGVVFRKTADADVYFNDSYSWTTQAEDPNGAGCSGEFYLEPVVRHEVGHLIGLGHSGVGAAVMYASVSSCNDKQIDSDDIQGRDAIYNCNPCTSSCGDNLTECAEVCDGTDLAAQTCVLQGFDGGTLGCNVDCTGFNVSGCFGCGDGTCDATEDSCSCPSDCGVPCGDGVLNCGEFCDGTQLNGSDCNSLGFDSGSLGCSSACDAYDTTSCCTANEDGLCFDGIDNDCDSLADSNDSDCDGVCAGANLGCSSDSDCCSLKCRGKSGAKVCKGDGGGCTVTESPEVSCSDGIDNDCDGAVDGTDSDCGGTGTSERGPRCSDGLDNDLDGLFDCADPDCGKARACR